MEKKAITIFTAKVARELLKDGFTLIDIKPDKNDSDGKRSVFIFRNEEKLLENCDIDYNTIKLYLDNMKQFLNDVSNIPSVLGSNTNIANISEVSMQILLMMANLNTDETKKWLNIGFKERFKRFQKILNIQGISAESDVDVIYNVSMPVASTEMIANLKALQEMGAISRETIMEKSEIITDVDVEKKRLEGEEQLLQKSAETVKDKEKPSGKVENE